MKAEKHTQRTFTKRFKDFREQYRVHIAATMAVLAALTFITAEIIPAVSEYIISSGIIHYIILILVLDIATALYSQRSKDRTWILKNQDEALPSLLNVVTQCRKEEIQLIEYAGATILPLIREIQRHNVPLRMLVQHPEKIEGIQKQRMIATLDTIFTSIFEDDQKNIEIRCYRLPFTIRGRRMGNKLLEIGWLTYDIKRQTAYGHQNPCVIVDLSTRKNENFRLFFERTFNDLWENPTTEDGQTVLERFGSNR